MITKTTALTVLRWGNSLAIRIPSTIARSIHLQIGTLVELVMREKNLIVRIVGNRKPTLDELLENFDPEKHSGETMADGCIGVENF